MNRHRDRCRKEKLEVYKQSHQVKDIACEAGLQKGEADRIDDESKREHHHQDHDGGPAHARGATVAPRDEGEYKGDDRNDAREDEGRVYGFVLVSRQHDHLLQHAAEGERQNESKCRAAE